MRRFRFLNALIGLWFGVLLFLGSVVSVAQPGAEDGGRSLLAGNRAQAAQTMTGTGTISVPARMFLPLTAKDDPPPCPIASDVHYKLTNISGPTIDHPDHLHADLNLAWRGFKPFSDTLGLILYDGETDGDPPQLSTLFAPPRPAAFLSLHRVYDWLWDPAQCDGAMHGCSGPLIVPGPGHWWEGLLVGLAAEPGEPLYLPARRAKLTEGGERALVLYAEETRLTLGYTRDDSVAGGYAVHLENICVDPNLLAAYRAQVGANGYRLYRRLPGIRLDDPLGTARTGEVRIAVRDRGTFMDPRSQKDWWQASLGRPAQHRAIDHPTGR